jgi:hypothetical protein
MGIMVIARTIVINSATTTGEDYLLRGIAWQMQIKKAGHLSLALKPAIILMKQGLLQSQHIQTILGRESATTQEK